MDLNKIEDPKFLKSLSISEMEELAREIRKFEIESISKTGGHLASNLGVVELSIALHYIFNSYTDKIIFDVGHQSYTHKILTGRASKFDTLRQYNGLSGFQKIAESKHDCWESGHSSTSLSAALGMAVARDLDNDDYSIIPVIGDGSITNGMALEALNQIGEEQRKMIIVFNDNQMSISKNTGILKDAFARLRVSKSYTNFKYDLKDNLNKNAMGELVLNQLKIVKDNVKRPFIDEGIFDEFNLEYLGPIDGHNLKELISAFKVACKKEGPVIIHVITTKGKGYSYCENDITGKWHGVSPFDVNNGKAIKTMPKNYLTNSEIVCNTLIDIAEEDKDVICITPAMVTGSKLSKFFCKYPKRSFDCGIAEEHAMTFSAGLAVAGKKPFISIYSSFLQRAYDQVNHDICRMNLNVTIGIDRAGLVGADGPTHHGVFDIGLLRGLPNIVIAQGKDSEELQNLLYTGMNYVGPYAIRYSKNANVYKKTKYEIIKIGTWVKENYNINSNCSILTYGENVVSVYNKIIENNLNINLINCRFIKPIDTNILDELALLGKPLVIYESDNKINGLSNAILEYYNEKNIHLKIICLGIDDHYVEGGSIKKLRETEKIDINYLFSVVNEI
jgi:1-deoxy-D-xylulose-5-phosphate synthase